MFANIENPPRMDDVLRFHETKTIWPHLLDYAGYTPAMRACLEECVEDPEFKAWIAEREAEDKALF